jgi:hypothetical protein
MRWPRLIEPGGASGRPAGWRSAVGAAAAASALACSTFLTAPLVGGAVHAQEGPGATVDEIVEYPRSWYGRSVIVAAPVADVLSARAFTLSDDDLFFGEELLVIARNPIPHLTGPAAASIVEGDRVQVSGTVDYLRVPDVEARLGLDLDDTLFAEWEGRPVIVADTVTVTPGLPNQGAVTIDDILDQPAALYGRWVTVRGPVSEVVGPHALTLSDDDVLFSEELLVVSATRIAEVPSLGSNAPLDERWAQATGTVRRFALADVERELGVDLNDARFVGWEGKPVVVANGLQMLGTDDVAAHGW